MGLQIEARGETSAPPRPQCRRRPHSLQGGEGTSPFPASAPRKPGKSPANSVRWGAPHPSTPSCWVPRDRRRTTPCSHKDLTAARLMPCHIIPKASTSSSWHGRTGCVRRRWDQLYSSKAKSHQEPGRGFWLTCSWGPSFTFPPPEDAAGRFLARRHLHPHVPSICSRKNKRGAGRGWRWKSIFC